MSAIAGIWRFDGRPDTGGDCRRMLSSQSIYGPHAVGQWSGRDFALGRCLFRTLPEDRHDDQPLVGAGGTIVLAADLRLDNRGELAAALGIPGAQTLTLCDAALLLKAYERWQEDCVARLVGDFAFAVWNATKRRLFLARDPLGLRPLHYHRGADFFAFASMAKGLHALPEIVRAPDEERVAEFVALLPEGGTRSFFKDVERIPSGHAAMVTERGVVLRRHWEPRPASSSCRTADDYAEGLRHHLETAVRARLRGANGTMGAHLSAGLDSSTVAATAAKALAPSGGRVIAFTGVPREGFSDGEPVGRIVDEGPHAAATAALYPNMEHVRVRGDARSTLGDLDRYFHYLEQPVLDPSNGRWINAINAEARAQKLVVMLSAEMGNFSISYIGNELLPQLFASGRWLRWIGESRALVRAGAMSWKGAMSKSISPFIPAALSNRLNTLRGRRGRELTDYSAIRISQVGELDARGRDRGVDFAYRPRKGSFGTRLWALRRVDLGNVKKGTLACWGLDERDPTADIRLVEFCLGVPAEQFLSGGVTRALARRAFADRLPPLVLNETRRGQQGADWYEGLDAVRAGIAEEVRRMEDCPSAARTLDVPRLNRLVEAWPQSGWESQAAVQSYRMALLRAVAVGHFLRKAEGRNS